MRDHLVAVDIGTASARAGIFDRSGTLIAKEAHPIVLHRPDALVAEQDSDDIWNAVCKSVRSAMVSGGISKERIAAIGFDATCSLVIRVRTGKAALSRNGGPHLDTICWMDHRARDEALEMSTIGGPVIQSAGGVLCPEMALPKLLWLKRHRPDLWAAADGFYDLADHMTFRATGLNARSVSTLVSKWGYQIDQEGWPADFLRRTGLSDLGSKAGIAAPPVMLGQSIGNLCIAAAEALGLDQYCRVAPGMIDAYAGALGLLGALPDRDLEGSAALVAGTSTCLITLHSTRPNSARSLWGPYVHVGLPGYFLTEGGQSAAGSLLEHVVGMHAAGGQPEPELHDKVLSHIAAALQIEGPGYGLPISVLPDFHGNRAPGADPFALGSITGLALDTSFESLCRLYWRTAIGLACGLRHIIETFSQAGMNLDRLFMAGGHARNPLLVQLYADMTGRPVFVPHMKEAILLGTAINAASAAEFYPGMREAAGMMIGDGAFVAPNPESLAYCEADYRRHLLMIRHRSEMASIPAPLS